MKPTTTILVTPTPSSTTLPTATLTISWTTVTPTRTTSSQSPIATTSSISKSVNISEKEVKVTNIEFWQTEIFLHATAVSVVVLVTRNLLGTLFILFCICLKRQTRDIPNDLEMGEKTKGPDISNKVENPDMKKEENFVMEPLVESTVSTPIETTVAPAEGSKVSTPIVTPVAPAVGSTIATPIVETVSSAVKTELTTDSVSAPIVTPVALVLGSTVAIPTVSYVIKTELTTDSATKTVSVKTVKTAERTTPIEGGLLRSHNRYKLSTMKITHNNYKF